MKKIILVLLVILTSLVYSNNLDNYESKRVFDKKLEIILTGNLEKYKNDPELERVFRYIEKSIWAEYLQYLKENKYEILEVKENNAKSTLIIKATFNSFEDIPIDEKIDAYVIEAYKLLKDEVSEDFFYKELIINIMNKFMKKSKKETKIIKVYMDKIDGKWDITDDDNSDDITDINKEFTFTIFPSYKLFYEVKEGIDKME